MAEGGEDIRQSIRIILSTSKGERVMRPDFGSYLNDLVFAPINTSVISNASIYVKEALKQWEPRIKVDDVEITQSMEGGSRLNISISYTVLSVNSQANLVYPFFLDSK